MSLDDVRLIRRPGRVVVPSMREGCYRLLVCKGRRCKVSRRVVVSSRPVTRVQAFSESHELRTALAAARSAKEILCPQPAAVWRAPSLATALDHAQAMLRRTGGMAAFRSSPAYRRADRAEAAAAEAVALGEPRAALAALLRAHRLSPREPRYLVAAAGLLTSVGAPREALALLERADDLEAVRDQRAGAWR